MRYLKRTASTPCPADTYRQYLCHDLGNLLRKGVLDTHLSDPRNVERAIDSAEKVVDNLRDYSPERLVALLPERVLLTREQRAGLEAALSAAFEARYGTEFVAVLRSATRRFKAAPPGEERSESLAALISLLKRLPEGIWLP